MNENVRHVTYRSSLKIAYKGCFGVGGVCGLGDKFQTLFGTQSPESLFMLFATNRMNLIEKSAIHIRNVTDPVNQECYDGTAIDDARSFEKLDRVSGTVSA